MDWIKITPADLESALNKNQLDILKAQSLQSPGRDAVEDVISNVVARIRAEVASSGLNAVDVDHARIPPELKECALRLAVEALHLRVPSIALSEYQIKHADLARQILSRAASGDFAVSAPIFGVRTGNAKKGVSAGSQKRDATRKTMGNL